MFFETWANNSACYDIDGYKCYLFNRKIQNKKSKRSSGGIAIYIEQSIAKGISIVKNYQDAIVWLKLDKLYFNLTEDIFLARVYIWSENSPMYNILNVSLFDILQNEINIFQTNGKVFLAGDLNARVGNKRDFIVCDRTVNLLNDQSYISDSQLPRNSMDSQTNCFGTKLLDMCKSLSLRIANGRLSHDSFGAFTFMNSRGSSVIDYLLLREENFNLITHFNVESHSEWSDHCPLAFNIMCNTAISRGNNESTTTRLIWLDQHREEFRQKIIANVHVFNSISDALDCNNVDSIDYCVERFSKILNEAGEALFSKTVKSGKSNSKNTFFKKAEWFDNDCRLAKSAYFKALMEYNTSRSDIDRMLMINKKTLYKRIVKSKRQQHKSKKLKEIVSLRHSKPRDFWKLFSKNKTSISDSLSIDDFYNYFQSLQNDLKHVDHTQAEQFCSFYNFNTDNGRFDIY